MGQYWEIICADKRETFKLAGFYKLLEILYCPPEGRGIAMLLALRGGSHEGFGRWAGNRVLLLGDYNEPDDLPSERWRDLGVDRRETGHSAIDLGNVMPLLPHALNVDHRGQYAEELLDLCEEGDAMEWAVVNLEKHELFTPATFGQPNSLTGMLEFDDGGGNWCLTGVPTVLPLLLASFPKVGGGGDPQIGHPMIGSWAANHVAVLPKDVTASDMSTEQWGDALDFGLHNFTDIGASVQDMLMAELTCDGVEATVPPYIEPLTSFFPQSTAQLLPSAADAA